MPQHDRNDEDFWTRSRRTRQSDKRSKRGRKRKDNDGTAEIDWTDPDLPSAAPPTGRARRESAPPAPGPEPALPQRPVPPRVAAAQRPEPFLNDPPIGGGPGAGARRGGQPAPLGSSEPGAGFAGGRRDRSHADMPTQALPAFGPPTPGPSGRPDTGRAPGTARRRAREAEGWSDGSSTNGPHLASGGSRPPALGAPAAISGPPSTSSLVPGMPRSGGHGADAAAAGPLPDDRTSSLVPGMRRSDSRDQADPGAPGASGRRSGRSAASELDAGAPGASGRRSAGRQLEPGAPGGSGRRAAALQPEPGPGSGRRPALSSDEGPGGSGRRAALSSDEGPGGSGRRAALSPDAGSGGSGRRPAMLQPDPGIDGGPARRSAAPQLDPGLAERVARRSGGGLDPGAPGASGRRQSTAPQPPPLASDLTSRQDVLGAGPAPGVGTRRRTGENPALVDRLEGLASRATPPHGAASSGHPQFDEPLAPDPLVDERGAPRSSPSPAPAPPPRPPPREEPRRGAGYDQPFEAPYDDRYSGDVYEDTYGDEPYDDFDEPSEPERRSGCARPMVALLAVGIFLVLLLLAGGLWVRGQINPGGEPGDAVTVEIMSGQSTAEIGQTLQEADVIANASVWSWYVRFKGGGDIQAGVYEIPTNLSMGEALTALEAKPLPPGTKRVTVPEGQTIAQIKQRVTASDAAVPGFTPEGFDAALADPAVRSKYLPADQRLLEGTFFPETYDLAEEADEAELLGKMRDEFDATMDDLGAEAGAAALQRSTYEVIIVASIVEEEARVDEDRAKVARVIYNRLADDQALFIDAINCYEKQQTPCVLTDPDFASDSQYNSRRHRGLPPTPIAAPGRASIEAALHPAEGDWMYYVLDPELPEGHHLFTASEADFEDAKARCRDAGLGCG